jgi:hypothetical protein
MRMKMASISNLSPRKRFPPPCHLDRSAAERRDLCVDASSWKCFSTERTRISYLTALTGDHAYGSP